MQSLLLGKHYGVPLLHQRHVLFNDTALAVQVPYASEDSPIASQTTSTAQPNGWIWDIGLPGRRGIGHVYSSAHSSDEDAERQLRAYVLASGGPADMPAPRKLGFEPGYRERFWHRNCVAIGLSAGFIEPLEASALALVELSAAWLADDMPATRAQMDTVAARFNEAFTYRWERVIDFLKLHYVLSRAAIALLDRTPRGGLDSGAPAGTAGSCGARARLRAAIFRASRKCSRPPAGSTSCTGWASARRPARFRPPRPGRRSLPRGGPPDRAHAAGPALEPRTARTYPQARPAAHLIIKTKRHHAEYRTPEQRRTQAAAHRHGARRGLWRRT
jgi:hypothetical protein